MPYITVALDAMGGDNAPSAVIAGAIASLADERAKLLLTGPEEILRAELAKHAYDKSRVEILHAPEVITQDEVPTTAIRQKKQSSLVLCLQAVKEGRADAAISAGSTGALLTGATVIIGRAKGVERPALATMLPNEKGFTLLIDSGANVDAKPSYLAQFAVMGSVYMERMQGIENPRVGLVNIGAEIEKGNAQVKEAHSLLAAIPDINFIGNAEARDIPSCIVDVAVCDGFVGNVILKYTEGLAKSLMDMVRDAFMSTLISKIGAVLAKNSLKMMKRKFDYSEIGGAPFLGLNALVVKAHGHSNAKAIAGAVNQCVLFSQQGTTKSIKEEL